MRIAIVIAASLLTSCLKGHDSTIMDHYSYNDTTWEFDYDIDAETPYGGSILQAYIENNFDAEILTEPLYVSLGNHYSNNQVYLIYTKYMHLRAMDFYELFDFVESGNNAILICEYLPEDIQYEFFIKDCIDSVSTSLVGNYQLHDSNLPFQLTAIEESEPTSYNFRIFDGSTFYSDIRNAKSFLNIDKN